MSHQVVEAIEKQMPGCGMMCQARKAEIYGKKKQRGGGINKKINNKQLPGQPHCSCKSRNQSHLNVLC